MLVYLVLANGSAQRKNFNSGVVPGQAPHQLCGSAETLLRGNLFSLAMLLITYKSSLLVTATFSSSMVQRPRLPLATACDPWPIRWLAPTSKFEKRFSLFMQMV